MGDYNRNYNSPKVPNDFTKGGFSKSCLDKLIKTNKDRHVDVTHLTDSCWRTEGCGKTYKIGNETFNVTVCQFGATLVSV
jgi:hypothetical protein